MRYCIHIAQTNNEKKKESVTIRLRWLADAKSKKVVDDPFASFRREMTSLSQHQPLGYKKLYKRNRHQSYFSDVVISDDREDVRTGTITVVVAVPVHRRGFDAGRALGACGVLGFQIDCRVCFPSFCGFVSLYYDEEKARREDETKILY